MEVMLGYLHLQHFCRLSFESCQPGNFIKSFLMRQDLHELYQCTQEAHSREGIS